jgi:hypothetical protein
MKLTKWALSGSSNPEIVVTPTTASEDVVSDLRQTQKGSRELLEMWSSFKELHVWILALDRVGCCPGKAAAMLDRNITCRSAWSEPSAQPHARACTSPKVAVGLQD